MAINKLRKIPNYNIPEVSHYLRLPVSTTRAWTKGQYNFAPLLKIAQQKPPLLSFNNLVELYVLYAITRKFKLPMRKLRLGLNYVKKEFKSEHPLLEKEFETDGITLFLRESGVLVDVSEDQGQIEFEELNTYLNRIERDKMGLPIRIYPFSRTGKIDEPKLITIDPSISFGRPVLSKKGIPVEIIAERFQAGETSSHLAKDYGVSVKDVDEAIRYELGLSKAA